MFLFFQICWKYKIISFFIFQVYLHLKPIENEVQMKTVHSYNSIQKGCCLFWNRTFFSVQNDVYNDLKKLIWNSHPNVCVLCLAAIEWNYICIIIFYTWICELVFVFYMLLLKYITNAEFSENIFDYAIEN